MNVLLRNLQISILESLSNFPYINFYWNANREPRDCGYSTVTFPITLVVFPSLRETMGIAAETKLLSDFSFLGNMVEYRSKIKVQFCMLHDSKFTHFLAMWPEFDVRERHACVSQSDDLAVNEMNTCIVILRCSSSWEVVRASREIKTTFHWFVV